MLHLLRGADLAYQGRDDNAIFDSRVTCPDLHYSDILTLSWLAHKNKQVKTVGMHTTMALELASQKVIGTLKCNTDSFCQGKLCV